jgi:1-acyl-sn-glycerol-3-phosphate acyltransferase
VSTTLVPPSYYLVDPRGRPARLCNTLTEVAAAIHPLARTPATVSAVTGFVRLALKHGVQIVPVVSIGGQETALFLGQGEHIARRLHLHRLLRIDVAPVQIAPPWGITVLDLPGRLPLPAKISIEVLSPIDLREELGGAGGDPEKGYELVSGRMQDALRELDEARTLPLIG